MKVVGVVGLPASGKGEFSKIATEMGIPVIVMGDRIRDAVEAAGLPRSDISLGATATRLRQEGGMDAIGKLCVPVIRKHNTPLVLVDGIRGDAEVSLFRQEFPGFVLISIRSSFTNRLLRVAARGRSDDFTSASELHIRDNRELGWGLGKALAQADLSIRNDGTLEEFSAAVYQTLETLRRAP
jgi:dephospho-CoA kinase